MSVVQQPPRSRPLSGCLMGCLAALALLLLPVLLVGGYGGWFLWQGFRNDPALAAAGDLVRHDGMAEAVLGRSIRITGVEGNAFSFIPGLGSQSDYRVSLEGSKARGTLEVQAEVAHGRVRLDAMILTGPDGSRYDLMHHTMAPAAGPTTSI